MTVDERDLGSAHTLPEVTAWSQLGPPLDVSVTVLNLVGLEGL